MLVVCCGVVDIADVAVPMSVSGCGVCTVLVVSSPCDDVSVLMAAVIAGCVVCNVVLMTVVAGCVVCTVVVTGSVVGSAGSGTKNIHRVIVNSSC